MYKGPKQWMQKTALTLAMVMMVSFGVLVPRERAHAQFSVPILESITLGQNIWEQVLQNVGEFLLQAGTVAAANILQTVGDKVAADAAEFVVTGNWGQNPLIFEKGWEDYLEDAGYGAAGEFLATLSENTTLTDKDGKQYGINLCSPNAPFLLYGIPAALFSQFKASEQGGKQTAVAANQSNQPRCNFKELIESWEDQADALNPVNFFAEFQQVFEIGQNDLSIASNAIIQGNLAQLSAQREAELERASSNTYKDLTSKISGKVITPKDKSKEAAELGGAKLAAQRQQDLQNSLIASGEGIVASIAGTFVNTLASKLMEKYFTDGVVPVAGVGPSLPEFPTEFSQGAGNKQAFDAVYADLYTPKIQEATTIDIVNEFLACPNQFPQQNNCTLDAKFAQAIQEAQTGEPLTVQKAIERGSLHGEWKLLPPDDPKNSQTTCATEAYCFSNLVKLRRARIIPIGWEIAAQNAQAGGVSLNEVVSNYHTCNYDLNNGGTADGVSDDAHPYCHLIDPNWVLKAPPMQCRAQGYTDILQSSEGATRQQSCVDDATCVVTDANGQCAGVWGYCTREKNAWRFDGNVCEEQFASCQTVQARQGGNVSLLLNTVDSEYCTEANVGCRAYHTERVGDGWDVAGERLYLNQFAESCTADAAGCSLLTDNNFSQIYLQVPPKELECTGDPTTDHPDCDNYAPICKAEDVGCTLYTPTNGDPAVAGIESPALQCEAQCVGYAQFAQQPTTLEPFGAIDYFIPSTAQACSATEVGCTGFTVVDGPNPEEVVYFSDLQQCITTTEAANEVFYTWEGSDTVGLQLRSFNFKTDLSPSAAAQGSAESGAILPEYAATDAALLAQYHGSCNADVYLNRETDPNYDPDCREFFDKNGKRVYRLLSEVIVASDSCATLRRNDAVSPSACSQTGGTPAEGGEFCLYKALQDMSQACGENAAGCRAYEGSEAGAGQIIYTTDFEPTDSDWGISSERSTEAVTVGGHSLKLGPASVASPEFEAVRQKTYTVTFWAKGNTAINAGMIFENGDGGVIATDGFQTEVVSLDSVWRQYTVGPFANSSVQVAQAAAAMYGAGDDSAQYFIDNVYVKEADGLHYVVKDSWNTPTQCDANPFDNLPGAALGCRAYTNQNNQPTFNTGFERVCREEVAGCQALINTYNSEDPGSETFNFNDGNPDIDGQVHPEDDVVVPADEIVYIVNRDTWSCSPDNLGCQAVGVEDADGVLQTTYIKNQPDNYETQLCKAYENRCDAFSNGSQINYFKDPGANTCVFRDKQAMPDGTVRSGWFKSASLNSEPEGCDPTLVTGGNQFGIRRNGDDGYTGQVGLCSGSVSGCTEFIDHHDRSDASPIGKSYYFIKNSSLDTASCGGQVNLNEGCVLLDDTSNPVKNWSSAQTERDSAQARGASVPPSVAPQLPTPNTINTVINVAGLDFACNAELMTRQCSTLGEGEFDSKCQQQAACLEVLGEEVSVTTSDEAITFGGEDFSGGLVKYPVMCYDGLDSESLVDFCGSQPDQDNTLNALCKSYEAGVITGFFFPDIPSESAFLQAEEALKKVKTKATVACGIDDSNIVVKVERDRICSEWLSCKTSFTVWDERTGKARDVCVDVGTCAEWSTGAEGTGECVRWVEDTDTNDKVLTRSLYTGRDTSWFGADYSGYSLYNKFQLTDLNSIVTGDGLAQSVALAYTNSEETSCVTAPDGASCSFDIQNTDNETITVEGSCYNQKCAIAPNRKVKLTDGIADLVQQSCRLYPEDDSPFPSDVVQNYTEYGDSIGNISSHANANTCQEGQPDCDQGCGYQKVFFGQARALPKYFDVNAELPTGICQGGFTTSGESKDGKSCVVRSDCSDARIGLLPEDRVDGSCQPLKATQRVFGTEGYCVEEDLRSVINGDQQQHSCQTWYPATLLSGSIDTFNQFTSAGYEPPAVGGGRYFCLNSSGNAQKATSHGAGSGTAKGEQCAFGCEQYFKSKGAESAPGCYPDSDNYMGVNVACANARKYDPENPKYSTQTINPTNDNHLNSQQYKLVVGAGVNAGPGGNQDFLFVGNDGKEDKHFFGYDSFATLKDANIHYADIERIGVYPYPHGDGSNFHDWMAWNQEMIIYPDRFLGPIKSETNQNSQTYCTDPDNCTYISGPVNQTFVGELCGDKGYPVPDSETTGWCGKELIWPKRMRLVWQLRNKLGNTEISLKTITPHSYNVRDNNCQGQNLFMMDAVFDEEDRLRGFDFRSCDLSGGANVNVGLVLYLREYCTEVAQVHNPDAGSGQPANKAWTDRLSNEQSDFLLNGKSVFGQGWPYGPIYSEDQTFSPYGSAFASEEPQYTKIDGAHGVNLPWVVAGDATSVGKSGFINAGSPLSCGKDGNDGCWSNRCIGGQNHAGFCNVQADCPAVELTTPHGDRFIDYGVCMGVSRPEADYLQLVGEKKEIDDKPEYAPFVMNDSSRRELLSQIFAAQFTTWRWEYIEEVGDWQRYHKVLKPLGVKTDYDNSFNIVTQAQPGDNLYAPRISGVECSDGVCSQTEFPVNSFGVNGQVSGIITTLSDSFSIQTQFYAEAAANQLPIKRIAVDWNEKNATPQYFEGLYKNRKPVCNGETFGDSDEACDEGFYQFVHHYDFNNCRPENIGIVSADGQGMDALLRNQGFAPGDRYCRFQPRVQILDNWGWCNADFNVAASNPECHDFVDGGTKPGCWNDLALPDEEQKCDVENFNQASTPFSGSIVVREEIQ